MWPQDSDGVLGSFLLVRKEDEDVGARGAALPAERRGGGCRTRARRSSGRVETRAAMVDLKFCDLLGTWQHVSLPDRGHSTRAFRPRVRVRRQLDPRVAGDQRERHAPSTRSPTPPRSTRSSPCRRSRSFATSATRSPRRRFQPRPARVDRAHKKANYTQEVEDRRHRVLRAGAGSSSSSITRGTKRGSTTRSTTSAAARASGTAASRT